MRKLTKSSNADPDNSALLRKRQRGRPPGIRRSEVLNRAFDFQQVFESFVDAINWESLRSAESDQDLNKAFAKIHPFALKNRIRPRYSLILEIVQESKFPKRSTDAQIKFLADSLGADGVISPRRSRNICAEERKKQAHKVIRREFYIECTCGYKGPALDGGCRKCGTGKGFTERALGLPQGKHPLEP